MRLVYVFDERQTTSKSKVFGGLVEIVLTIWGIADNI